MYGWLVGQKSLKSNLRIRGFGILDMLLALTVAISLMTLGSKYAAKYANDLINQTTAQQLSQLAIAINNYVHDHFAEIQQATDMDRSVIWNSQEIRDFLVTNGYLPKTLPEHNPYNQSYQVVIQQPKPQLLQLMLLTQDGKPISESSLRKITQQAGSKSGYVSHLEPEQVSGIWNSWKLLPVDIEIAIPPPGHLANLNYLHANDVLSASSLLFRKKVEGHEEYSRMEADLELADGAKIWFNQGSSRSTIIEGGKIMLTSGQASITLKPENLTVNTTNGISGAYGIETNSNVKVKGNIEVGQDFSAGRNVKANGNITSLGDITASGNLFAEKLKIGSMELTSSSLKFNGIDIRRDADIPEYHTPHMYERGYLWQTALNHCRNHWSRLFVVNDRGWARHLVMCLNSPSSNGSDYWVVATGDYRHPQTLNRRVP